MELKKYPKADLSRWSHIFFLTGLAIMLGASYMALESKTYTNSNTDGEVLADAEQLESDIPITEFAPPPPPPPPPARTISQVLEVVEDDIALEETVIESTELNQNSEIVLSIQDIEEEEIEEEEIVFVPFAVIEDVPIYPGCESLTGNEARKTCMADHIMKFVQKNFNTELAVELGLEGRQRISVQFKIDKTGQITGIRSRAPHPRLEKEAARVLGSLPKMVPGKQRGKPVGVLYSLPILFQVEMSN